MEFGRSQRVRSGSSLIQTHQTQARSAEPRNRNIPKVSIRSWLMPELIDRVKGKLTTYEKFRVGPEKNRPLLGDRLRA